MSTTNYPQLRRWCAGDGVVIDYGGVSVDGAVVFASPDDKLLVLMYDGGDHTALMVVQEQADRLLMNLQTGGRVFLTEIPRSGPVVDK